MKKISIYIFAIFTFTFIIKILVVHNYNFAMTYDQGRDLMEIRSIVIGLRPALVGPTTSINGAFLGPFWYYFNVIPFILGQGDPAWIMYWQILWYQISGLTIWIYFRKKQANLGLIATTLYLLMPIGFYSSRYFWNAHAMPFVITWLILFLHYTINKSQPKNYFILGIITGIPLQTQAAFGILAPILSISILLFYRSTVTKFFKKIILFTIGLFITIIPQLIYEFRHNFIITKTLLGQFTGTHTILGQNLSFTNKLIDRYHAYTTVISDTNHLPRNIVIILSILSLIYISHKIFRNNVKSQINQFSLINLSLITLSIFLYLIFPQQIKSWYVKGLAVPIVFIQALCLFILSNRPLNKIKRINYNHILTISILILSIFFTTREQIKYLNLTTTLQTNDPSNLSNHLQMVDWIYQQSYNQGFEVYSYLPSVYDYSYQHEFWWYGTNKYGYQPYKISYSVDPVPQYIKSQHKMWTKTKPINKNKLTFLIIEPNNSNTHRSQDWQNNFKHLCLQKHIEFPWGTIVEKRASCKS